MTRPLVAYRSWLESLPESQPLELLSFSIRASLPIWPPMSRHDVGTRGDLRALVCQLLQEAESSLGLFGETAIVGSLILITELEIHRYETEDPKEWLEHMQRAISTGIEPLVKTAKEAILSRPEIERAHRDLAMSWRVLRSEELSLQNLSAWKDEQGREEMSEITDTPEVRAAAERIRRALRGEQDEN